MNDSKLTSKFQATIPRDIRNLLNLKSGDRVIFEVTKENRVELRKATKLDIAYLKSLESTLNEWNSIHDEEDFSDL